MIEQNSAAAHVSLQKAANLLGITRRKVDEDTRSGKMRSFRIPGGAGFGRRIPVAELLRYAREHNLTLNRGTLLPGLAELRLILLVSPEPTFGDLIPRAMREVVQVADLFSAGLVLGRRWFDVVVFDGDRIDNCGIVEAAKVVRAVSIDMTVYFVTANPEVLKAAKGEAYWKVRDVARLFTIDDVRVV